MNWESRLNNVSSTGAFQRIQRVRDGIQAPPTSFFFFGRPGEHGASNMTPGLWHTPAFCSSPTDGYFTQAHACACGSGKTALQLLQSRPDPSVPKVAPESLGSKQAPGATPWPSRLAIPSLHPIPSSRHDPYCHMCEMRQRRCSRT